ncbi:Fur family transcriptional regulator, ferric uptake regulator [Lebetimonas natsushimae]|uniref:Ferric uptake regulation protein n=1 Tax=Lebetimonas natsushimae TaxID=1936991 RepID=A0A292YD11_9BACT|nr:transcriptional repressor [Lebetimonas natsushimae]GAX87134.1 Fur family transcriptional regulator, ferric uptake regulator [Lebetimonas natsushimae]
MNLREFLKKQGLNFTKQREIIFSTLYNNPNHLTAEDLYLVIKKQHPELNIGIATVYRTLAMLEENGLISFIQCSNGKKFEISKSHHDHLICTACGKIVEFHNNEIEKLQEKIAKENSFKLTNHIMQLYGLCEECQKKEKEKL